MSDTPIYQRQTCTHIAALPMSPWRIKGILPTRGLAAIFGPSGSGKSFLATDIAASIALGNDWFGHRVRKCPVTYVALEGEGGFPKRLLAWAQYNEHPLPDDLQFIINQPFDITNPVHVRQLATVIPKDSVIIIDTLNRAAPGKDENSSEGMGAILEGAKLLQRLTDCLVILIHHTGKDESRGLRGHTSLLAALDACIEVKRMEDARSWTTSKSKDDNDGAEFCFKLFVEHLGSDEDGDPITSCAIEPVTEAALPRAPKKKALLKENQKIVLEAISAHLATSPLLTFDEALEVACNALAKASTKHRSTRARESLWSLVKMRELIYDEETHLIELPRG